MLPAAHTRKMPEHHWPRQENEEMRVNRAMVAALLTATFSVTAAIAEAPAGAPGKRPSPTEAYMKIHKMELDAKSYDDLLVFRSKASIAHDGKVSQEEKANLFPLLKMMFVKNPKVTDEKIDGDKAIIHAAADSSEGNTTEKATGEITLVWEDGQWKMEKEKWESKVVSK
jgi:hypothetical protein